MSADSGHTWTARIRIKQWLYSEAWPHRHTIQVADSSGVRCEGRSAEALTGDTGPLRLCYMSSRRGNVSHGIGDDNCVSLRAAGPRSLRGNAL